MVAIDIACTPPSVRVEAYVTDRLNRVSIVGSQRVRCYADKSRGKGEAC